MKSREIILKEGVSYNTLCTESDEPMEPEEMILQVEGGHVLIRL